MAYLYLVFQTDNPMATTRFRNFLSRHGWQRLTAGVYLTLESGSFDQEAFWEQVRGEFSFDPKRHFFAIFQQEDRAFIPTDVFYNRAGPKWPVEHPTTSEEP